MRKVCNLVDVLDANLEEINMLNLWGERMLSLVDLIKRDTIPLEVAAYLMEGIQNGAGVLIGAWPNRAGKTTLMGALLGVISSLDRIITIEDARVIPQLTSGSRDRPKTYVIPEVSRHGRGYLWGSPVVDVTRLVDSNTRLVTNLHLDSLEEVKDIFDRFGSEEALNVFNFIIFIVPPRVVDEVWEYNTSSQSHERIYSNAGVFSLDFDSESDSQKSQKRIKWEKFLLLCLNQDIYRIEEVAYALKEYKNE
ncbi:hypothetical protein KAS14_04290 [Candidatus Bathyarchaeota archaeon]|nr:hypothetical protein [Candidatus Bathyarchaeota archaeon]